MNSNNCRRTLTGSCVPFIKRYFFLVAILVAMIYGVIPALAQTEVQWSPQKPINGFDPETPTPVLFVDQDGTVHAFSSQWFGDSDREDQNLKAIVYNQWNNETGWTMPVDIVLSPFKNEARVLDALIDSTGIIHLVFFGGDGNGGNIYYTNAHALSAEQASAWSLPEVVVESAYLPEVGAMASDDNGNLVVVYSGYTEGNGLYTIFSTDWGESWTEPRPIFLTYESSFPFILKLDTDQSGLIHAVWDVRDLNGNGREINYARLNLSDQQWSDPITLAGVETGYGILNPSIIEHNGVLFVAYSGITLQRSEDGGQTWSDPEQPFSLAGVNGKLSFVVDSNDVLHMIWAQRKSGSPDIHGVWHSTWQDNRWSEPEAVVYGPRIVDTRGYKGFDPFDVQGVIVLGNTLLAAWRTDPGEIKANGIWYTVGRLDAPLLPKEDVPEFVSDETTTVNEELAITSPQVPEPISAPPPSLTEQKADGISDSVSNSNPIQGVFLAIVPTIVLVILVILIKTYLVFQKNT